MARARARTPWQAWQTGQMRWGRRRPVSLSPLPCKRERTSSFSPLKGIHSTPYPSIPAHAGIFPHSALSFSPFLLPLSLLSPPPTLLLAPTPSTFQPFCIATLLLLFFPHPHTFSCQSQGISDLRPVFTRRVPSLLSSSLVPFFFFFFLPIQVRLSRTPPFPSLSFSPPFPSPSLPSFSHIISHQLSSCFLCVSLVTILRSALLSFTQDTSIPSSSFSFPSSLFPPES